MKAKPTNINVLGVTKAETFDFKHVRIVIDGDLLVTLGDSKQRVPFQRNLHAIDRAKFFARIE